MKKVKYTMSICGTTTQKQSLGCTQFKEKPYVCRYQAPKQIAHFHSKLHAPKLLLLLGGSTYILFHLIYLCTEILLVTSVDCFDYNIVSVKHDDVKNKYVS